MKMLFCVVALLCTLTLYAVLPIEKFMWILFGISFVLALVFSLILLLLYNILGDETEGLNDFFEDMIFAKIWSAFVVINLPLAFFNNTVALLSIGICAVILCFLLKTRWEIYARKVNVQTVDFT